MKCPGGRPVHGIFDLRCTPRLLIAVAHLGIFCINWTTVILTWQILFLMLPVPRFELIEWRMTEKYRRITAENELSSVSIIHGEKIWAIRAQCKASCKHGEKPRHSYKRDFQSTVERQGKV